MDDKPRWAVGNVRTGEELDVADHVRHCGAEVYCPQYTITVRPARKRRPMEVSKAALPSYLFIDAHTIEDLEEIYRDSRFHYFLRDIENELRLLRDEDLAPIRSLEGSGAFVAQAKPGPVFVIGEMMKVLQGPYRSYEGRVQEVSGGRVKVDGIDFSRAVWLPYLHLLHESI